MKKTLCLIVLALTTAVFAASPKYVFMFIGDGMSLPQRMTTEEYMKVNLNKQLVFNHFPVNAATRTSSFNSFVTDSAASGTALACGTKTLNGAIGVDPQGNALESSAFVAKKKGMKVGIITSVTINHATPSSFYAHRPNRGQYYEIGLDMLASQFDYFGGGGMAKVNDEKHEAYKGSLYDLAAKAGYTVAEIKTKADMDKIKPGTGKVWLYGEKESNLKPELDAPADYVCLVEYLRKGIELLDNPNGFFMMCEGGAIDYGGHANDAGYVIHEGIGLNKCVEVALDFARKHPQETLIVVTGDHETGGLNAGFANTGITIHPERLKLQKNTGGKFGSKIAAEAKANAKLTFDDIKPLITDGFGLKFDGNPETDGMVLRPFEVEAMRKEFNSQFVNPKGKRSTGTLVLLIMNIFNKRTGLTYTTGGHSAMPVITSAWGVGAELFANDVIPAEAAKNPVNMTNGLQVNGSYENSDVSRKLKSLLN